MIEIVFSFFVLVFGLFMGYLSQYITQYREAYKLWIQEIVYDNDPISRNDELKTIKEKAKLTEEEKELFSKIEYLTIEICSLGDLISTLFSLLCISFFIMMIILIVDGKTQSLSLNNSISVLNELIESSIIPLILVTILFLLLFLLLPKILKYGAGIDIITPSNTNEIDAKLFDIWYKHRCFEYRHPNFKNKLQPIRLYNILAQKYMSNEQTFDGKEIWLSDDLIENLKKEELIPHDFFKK